LVDSGDDLLSDSGSINMLRIEAITESRYTSSDLVKLDTLLTPILENSQLVVLYRPNMALNYAFGRL
jgi:hypothetical protein